MTVLSNFLWIQIFNHVFKQNLLKVRPSYDLSCVIFSSFISWHCWKSADIILIMTMKLKELKIALQKPTFESVKCAFSGLQWIAQKILSSHWPHGPLVQVYSVWAIRAVREKSGFGEFWATFEGGFFNFLLAQKNFAKLRRLILEEFFLY